MRTILSILILLISFSATAQPNQNGMKRQKRMENMKNMTPEQQATLWSKKMTLELELNPTQQEQIYSLILEKARQHKIHKKNRRKEKPSDDKRFQMQVDMLDEKIKMQNAMKSILNPDQYEKWKKIEKQKERKKRKHYKMKKEKK